MEAIFLFLPWLPLAIAGGLGGVIRWWAAKDGWRAGLVHVLIGAIIGRYVGPAFFTIVQPVADFSGMDPQDARVLGAHLCGVVGINLYAIPMDLVRARAMAVKASLDREPKP